MNPVSNSTENSCKPLTEHLLRLGIVLLLAIGVRAWVLSHTEVPSRDCLIFVRYALHLQNPPFDLHDRDHRLSGPLEVMKKAHHPPGYSAAILATSKILHPSVEATADAMTFSAQLVSAIAGVLLLIPLYSFVAIIFGRNVAFVSSLLFGVMPVFVEVTSDGISDGLFLLTATIAIWFAIRALEFSNVRKTIYLSAFAGIFCGLGYWIRPDILVVAVAIGLTFAGCLFGRLIRRESWKYPLLAGFSLTLGTLVVAVPYMLIIGKVSNKAATEAFVDKLQGNEIKPGFIQRPVGLKWTDLPLAAWWNPAEMEGKSKTVWAIKSIASEYAKSAHYGSVFFAIFGLLVLASRWFESRIMLLLLVILVHVSILFLLATNSNYVSQRHTLLTVMMTTIFAAVGIEKLGHIAISWFRRGTVWLWGSIWVIVLLGIALPRDLRTLHPERAGHKQAGFWLAENAKDSEPIVDPFGWTEFYASRTLYGWPTANPYAKVIYAITEPNTKSHHSRLPWLQAANELAKQGERVWIYPPNSKDDEIRVAIYRCPPLPVGHPSVP